MNGPTRGLWLAGLCLWAIVACGCAAAAVPIAGDVAGEAVKQSANIVWWGKTESFEPVSIDQADATVHQAATDLALTFVSEEHRPDQWKLTYRDDHQQQIVVTLESRTQRVTRIRVDVGIFGTYGMGAVTMRQILADMAHHTPPASAPASRPSLRVSHAATGPPHGAA